MNADTPTERLFPASLPIDKYHIRCLHQCAVLPHNLGERIPYIRRLVNPNAFDDSADTFLQVVGS